MGEREIEEYLGAFIRESNRIEGIRRDPSDEEFEAHRVLFELDDRVEIPHVEAFVLAVAGEPLRSNEGMNVRVGHHVAPPGGRNVVVELEDILWAISRRGGSPYENHHRYETLHPFMDGNGRSGRALWAWQMLREGEWPGIRLGFLHAFYYQSLASGPTRIDRTRSSSGSTARVRGGGAA